jgi:gas vesicle protein GvpA/GvpJ/GvpM family
VGRKRLTNPEDANLIEILDRVLDNGIVVDPSTRVLLMGMELRNMSERMVVDSAHYYPGR